MVYWYIDEKLGEKFANEYYENEQRKIRKLVDFILFKLKFSDVNSEDFYNLADEIFCDTLKRYDGKQDFNGFLYSCLMNKFKTEMTRQNRIKRKSDKNATSLNDIIDNSDGKMTVEDTIADKKTVESEIFEEKDEHYSSKMLTYLSRLSNLQKEILRLTIAGYSPSEMREELHITEKQYEDCQMAIHSYRNISLLF